MPGIVKIGYTIKTASERSNDLYTTGVPTPFIVEVEKYVNNPKEVEQKIHMFLSSKRISETREFFRVDVDKVKPLFDLIDTSEKNDTVKAYTSIAQKYSVKRPVKSFKEALESQGYIIDSKYEDSWISFPELKAALIAGGAAENMSDTAIGRELTNCGLLQHAVKLQGKVIRVRRFVIKLANTSTATSPPTEAAPPLRA